MMKKRVMNMKELIRNNKQEIVLNKLAMELIEKKVDEKLKSKVNNH